MFAITMKKMLFLNRNVCKKNTNSCSISAIHAIICVYSHFIIKIPSCWNFQMLSHAGCTGKLRQGKKPKRYSRDLLYEFTHHGSYSIQRSRRSVCIVDWISYKDIWLLENWVYSSTAWLVSVSQINDHPVHLIYL